ncbi:MAG: IMP dehydrogenase [Planctomycetota bacterium]
MATLSKKSSPSAPATVPGTGPGGLSQGGGKIIDDGITFDDVLLVPQRSAVLPSTADVRSRLTARIPLHIPLVSAPMDTVTESRLAIALAQEGGIGIVHKNLSPEDQAREVAKVKRSANGVITDPITLGPDDTVRQARELMHRHHVSGFPVTEGGSEELRSGPGQPAGRVLGILTRRDLKFVEDTATKVTDVMTDRGLVTAPPNTTLAEAEVILNKNKVEKLILVDGDFRLVGLITMRDIERLASFPSANTDERGRLRCGAAVGPGQMDRVEALIKAEADVITVDTAHGHSQNVLDAVREIKSSFEIEVIAGNVATAAAAHDLALAGADAVKVGIGPGSICTTRVVTGVGVPQITAVMHACEGVRASGLDVPVIADGGVRQSGDIAKAIAAGADCVMMGGLFAGLDESPGELVISGGRRYKAYRGMGSEGAMMAGSADRYRQADKLEGAGQDGSPAREKFVPEGVEGLVPYRGALAEFVYQLVGGLRSAMGYTGCQTTAEMRRDARFVRVSPATVIENHPHDIRITKESPNYSPDSTPGARGR